MKPRTLALGAGAYVAIGAAFMLRDVSLRRAAASSAPPTTLGPVAINPNHALLFLWPLALVAPTK